MMDTSSPPVVPQDKQDDISLARIVERWGLGQGDVVKLLLEHGVIPYNLVQDGPARRSKPCILLGDKTGRGVFLLQALRGQLDTESIYVSETAANSVAELARLEVGTKYQSPTCPFDQAFVDSFRPRDRLYLLAAKLRWELVPVKDVVERLNVPGETAENAKRNCERWAAKGRKKAREHGYDMPDPSA